MASGTSRTIGCVCCSTQGSNGRLVQLHESGDAPHAWPRRARSGELARYKLGRVAGPGPDGYHRVTCPAHMGKLRCPLRPASMALCFDRPGVLVPPEQAPACCTQHTTTVPPQVNAKTAQRHDYPGKACVDDQGNRHG